jgi:phenylacetate-CoA ligase
MISDLVRSFGRTLAQTEWLSADDLHLYQAPLLGKLLAHARENTDFYRDRFDFDLASPDAIEAAWPAIPILTPAEAVANRERLFARTVPPEVGPTLEGLTSGSTGFPFPYRRSNITLVAAQALNERMYRWWGVDGRKPLARIAFDRSKNAAPPDGATLSGWHSAYPDAPQYVLSTAADIKTQAEWLADRRPAYLASYSNLLKEIARASGSSSPQLKFELLFSFGTVVDDEARSICRKALGAEIADTYGADEVGHFASQCPQCSEYHISAEATRVEVLRADGSPAAPGEIGRVIVTSLYNYAQPMIRYEPGDLAEAGSEQARCRRGLRSLRRILGRYRNVFRFRDGTIRSPSPERFGIRDMISMQQSQVIQHDFDRIEILFVSDGRDLPIDLPALTERIRSVLGQPVTVTVRRVDAIERSPSGKYEDCISLVPAG